MVDEQTQENFITCLASLRLLAKVLGLLVSLPYRSESNTTKEIITTQIEIRSKVCDKNYEQMSKAVLFNKFSIIFAIILLFYYPGFTIIKLTSMSSKCHS